MKYIVSCLILMSLVISCTPGQDTRNLSTPASSLTRTATKAPIPTITLSPTLSPTVTITPTSTQWPLSSDVTFNFGDSVTEEEQQAVMQGVRLANSYLQEMGFEPFPVDIHVYVDWKEWVTAYAKLNSRSEGQVMAQHPEDTWWGGEGNLGSLIFYLSRSFRPSIDTLRAVTVHEYIHTAQLHLYRKKISTGYSELPNSAIAPTWLLEGVALYFEEVIPAKNGLGLAADFKLADARSWQEYDSLREFETYFGMRKYNLWWEYAGATASEVLAQKYGDKALMDYFANRAAVATWQEAFEKTFKITPNDFYNEFDKSRSKIEATATLKSSSFRPDPSICSEDAPIVNGNRLVCLGSIVDETISSKPIYLFRIEGLDFSTQPAAVLDTIDVRSDCNRKQWGRMEADGQVMWIELEIDSGKCTVTLELPGNSISSSIVLGEMPDEAATSDVGSFIPDSSICLEDGIPMNDVGLVCLGSIVDETISSQPIYLFRVEGFDFSTQPVAVLDTIDARSDCNRKQWGRMEADGQIMWIELATNSGRCTITLQLPGNSISSSIELP